MMTLTDEHDDDCHHDNPKRTRNSVKKLKKGALEYLLHPTPHPIRIAPGKLRQMLKAALRMKAIFLLDSLAYVKIDLITNTVLWDILYTHDHTSL